MKTKNLKVGNTVLIITGSNKKKTGVVLGFYKENYVFIEGINMRNRFINKFDNLTGKKKKIMIFRESHIHISNVKKVKE